MIEPGDPDIGIPFNIEESWDHYVTLKFLASIGIPTAPFAGGYTEWPEWLMNDLAIIAAAETAIRARKEKERKASGQ